jgi:alcohol dehydrogenase class IV
MTINTKFELNLPQRVIFETGSRFQIKNHIITFGNRVLVIHSKSHPLIPEMIQGLKGSDIEILSLEVTGEPSIESVTEILYQTRNLKFDCVIGIGGGSVIDTAKAISALKNNPGPVTDFLEVVGQNLPLKNPPIPYIAIPTTAGTGSEVTKNAVLNVTEKKIKVSLRSNMMIPRLAIIDPELTYSMPPEVTASTGMDAIVQLIEPFISIKANPFTDAICREGLKTATKSIRNAFHDPLEPESRIGMSYASLSGGIALANSGLGAVHGFAGVIGGMYPVPHGKICAALLAGAIQINLEALANREIGNPVREKFRELAVILTGRMNAQESDLVEWSRDICSEVGIRSLSTLGIIRSEFATICEKAAVSSSMKGNPIILTQDELQKILEISY